ncbi:MAG: TonB-dependent receptor domain-containing protein [Bacteroidales bacterium]
MKDIIRPVPAPAQECSYPNYNPMRAEVREDSNSGFFEVNENIGEIYSQGAELDINYQVFRFQISLGYSFTDGEDKTSSANLPKVSQHKLNTNVSYSNNNLFESITARYYSDIWTDPYNSLYGVGAANEGNIPGAFTLYSNLGYRLNSNITLKLIVDNALNTKHYGSAPYAESIWIQPRAPQSLLKVYGGLSVDF